MAIFGVFMSKTVACEFCNCSCFSVPKQLSKQPPRCLLTDEDPAVRERGKGKFNAEISHTSRTVSCGVPLASSFSFSYFTNVSRAFRSVPWHIHLSSWEASAHNSCSRTLNIQLLCFFSSSFFYSLSLILQAHLRLSQLSRTPDSCSTDDCINLQFVHAHITKNLVLCCTSVLVNLFIKL